MSSVRPLHHPKREDISLTGVLYALSDPVRLCIVRCLSTGEEQTCGALDVPVTKSTASHHFKVLREVGIIRMRPEGTSYRNSLRRDDLEARFPGLLDVVLQAAEPL
jgi:DNA-binding transcriptional ArsR family regulator